MRSSILTAVLASCAGLAAAGPAGLRFRPARMPVARDTSLEPRTTVDVVYPEGSVTGVSLLGVDGFRGIPFVQPAQRLKPPVRFTSSIGHVDATGIGPSCPQMYLSDGSGAALLSAVGTVLDLPFVQKVTGAKEDCLTLNIERPTGTTADSKLPVLFWIFGGGFEFGTNAMYDGVDLIAQGVKLGEPFIFVAVNYRTGAYGFLGGKEVKADGAANLGLLDQRVALEWVADNIAAFGGDPDKVTIWGESAGSISCFDQMALYGGNITYKGKPLFRGAILDSGSVVPTEAIDSAKAQGIYDQVVAAAGCASASDTLACLRSVDDDTFLGAANSVPGIASYNSLALSYLPRQDGVVLEAIAPQLVVDKKYAPVPMIIGDQEDEGTIFAIVPHNVTTTSKIVKYLKDLYFHQATTEQITDYVSTYPANDITAGSPFRTGLFNELFPGYKRLAAILGDMTFTLSRRIFLSATTANFPDVPVYSYLASYDYGTPFLGTFHASDILQTFYGVLPNHASASIQTYYINFVTTGDPNKGASVDLEWPQWQTAKNLLQFWSTKTTILADDFRSASYEALYANMFSFGV